VKSIENIDNDTRSITKTSFGIIDPGNSMTGTVYLDGFETHQGSHIGLDPSGPAVNPPPQPGDLVFADDFESGDLSNWISAITDGGDLSASTTSAYQGSYGLQALIDDNSNLRAIDSSPLDETHYRARFYFNPNSLVMSSGKAHFILDGMYLDTNDAILRIELIYENGQYKLRTRVMKDNYAYINSSKYVISDDWHVVEVEWQASSAPGANDGFINFWIDGNLMETISNIDNDLHTIGEVRLGATAGVDAGTAGSMFFDNFESRRNTYIGP
jgi:hypothetical protein